MCAVINKWSAVGIFMLFSACSWAAWLPVVTEKTGRRMEIDIKNRTLSNGIAIATVRTVLDRPIIDLITAEPYRIIEAENRFNCAERTITTLRRSFFREEGNLLRHETVTPLNVPIRAGTPDDRFLREACRPKTDRELGGDFHAAQARTEVNRARTTSAANRAPNRASNVPRDTRRPKEHLTQDAAAAAQYRLVLRTDPASETTTWSYAGATGPAYWGKLRPEYAACSSGRLQSPINVHDGIAVDLDLPVFNYQPVLFTVTDEGHNLSVTSRGGDFSLRGEKYLLTRIEFRHPAETLINGRAHALEAQLLHKSENGRLAIVSILFEVKNESPAVQMVLNNIPLERRGAVDVTLHKLDMERWLPEDRRYFTFIGSLTTPPCTENVLWIVFQQPMQLSPDQLAIFHRLYNTPNVRPVQPLHSRIIKESR